MAKKKSKKSTKKKSTKKKSKKVGTKKQASSKPKAKKKAKKEEPVLHLQHFTFRNPTIKYAMIAITILGLSIIMGLRNRSPVLLKIGGYISVFMMLWALLESIKVTKQKSGDIYKAYFFSNVVLALFILILVGLLLIV